MCNLTQKYNIMIFEFFYVVSFFVVEKLHSFAYFVYTTITINWSSQLKFYILLHKIKDIPIFNVYLIVIFGFFFKHVQY